MTLPISIQQRAVAMKRERIPSKIIALELAVSHQDLIRFFHNLEHRHQNSKYHPDEPGELDDMHLTQHEEAISAARMWGERMNFARWDTKRREGQG